MGGTMGNDGWIHRVRSVESGDRGARGRRGDGGASGASRRGSGRAEASHYARVGGGKASATARGSTRSDNGWSYGCKQRMHRRCVQVRSSQRATRSLAAYRVRSSQRVIKTLAACRNVRSRNSQRGVSALAVCRHGCVTDRSTVRGMRPEIAYGTDTTNTSY